MFIEHCRVCESATLVPFLDLGDQPHCNSLIVPGKLSEKEPYYPLQVCFCSTCTTVQLNYTVPKEEMFSEYLYVSGTTQTLRTHFQESTERLVSELGLEKNDLVVDIGSNDGTWLKCYQDYGIRTLGVEPARNITKIARENGVETLHDFFNKRVADEIIASKGHPRLVTAAGVFFHLEELLSVTEGVAALIADTGVFYVQAIYLGEILRNTEFDNIYHEHLTYWTIRALDRLFDKFGLQIVKAGLLPIHGGSLELFVARKGTRPVHPSVERMRAEEETQGYHLLETYQAFADRVWAIGRELDDILKGFEEKGRTVHAFGAPAKGATLLNTFRIDHTRIPQAVEKNPLKVGKWIPGARIPIVDEDKTEPPDAYLVLPWNFVTEFLKNKREYILNGGAFIVPIPFPYVIDRTNYEQHTA